MAKSGPFGRIPQMPPMPPRVPSVAVDRLRKVIEAGHLVMFNSPEDLIFEVADVRPILDPSLGPGQAAMQVTIKGEFRIPIVAASPCRAFVVIGITKARQEAEAAQNGGQQRPTGLVLTDPPAAQPEPEPDPEPKPEPEETHVGVCDKCGEQLFLEGLLGTTCLDCGVGTYQKV